MIYKIYLRHLDCIFSLSHTYQLIVTLWPSKIDTIQLRVGGITGVENFQNCQNRRSRKTLAQNCQIQLRKLPQPQKSLRDFFGLRPLASQKIATGRRFFQQRSTYREIGPVGLRNNGGQKLRCTRKNMKG